jgi:hypothetical protein
MFEKNYKIEDFIGTFDNFVKSETCDLLIDLFEKEKTFNNTWNRKQSENVSGDFKNDESLVLTRDHIEGSGKNSFIEIITNLRETVDIYLKETDILNYMGVKDLNICVNKIQKTLPSQGYHIWHVEKGYTNACSRVLVYTIYLNDVVTGGETEFLFQKKRVTSKKGRICIFPAHFPYVHRGNPPLDGIKYIITSWLHSNYDPAYPYEK